MHFSLNLKADWHSKMKFWASLQYEREIFHGSPTQETTLQSQLLVEKKGTVIYGILAHMAA
jgi:hypothetical protein